MEGLTREIADGSKADELVKAFSSALAGRSGPERCIELLGPEWSTASITVPTVLAMFRDADRDGIRGSNVEGRVLRSEALCQTAILLSMCKNRTLDAKKQLVRKLVAHHHHHQRREKEAKKTGRHQESSQDQSEAEYWQMRTEFHLSCVASYARRMVKCSPEEIEENMKNRKKIDDSAARKQAAAA